MKLYEIKNFNYNTKRILAENAEFALSKYRKAVENSLSYDYSVDDVIENIKECKCLGEYDVRSALVELEYDELKSVFNDLINTDRIFWDLLSYIEEDNMELAINYLVDKLVNDCTETEIFNKINNDWYGNIHFI